MASPNYKSAGIVAVWGIATFLLCFEWPLTTQAKSATGSVKGVVKATTQTSGTRSIFLTNARVTLVNRDLPEQVFKTITDDAGAFGFTNLPAANYLLSAEADGLPKVTREISLTEGATLFVEIELTASVSESVTVRDEEGLLSTAETSTSNSVLEKTLKNVPLRAENYESALPLTPGVVRASNGDDHVKGARSGQSAYTVNGADVTDPVTGNLAFDLPLEAAASVQVEENPYSSEIGRLTGGATNLETKGGGNKFKVSAARVFPTFRYFLKGPIDSFRPRITFSGPIIRDRFFFLQSFEYRFTRVRVPSLAAPGDDSTSENFSSFTQLDFTINKNHRAKFVGALFPQKVRSFGLNTFNPQETTPNIKRRGTLFSVSEQAIFRDTSFLSSTLSYKTSGVDIFPKGEMPLTLAPEGSMGNYFANTSRRSRRLQWQETYYVRPFTAGGQHSLRIGGEFDRTNISASFHNNSILVRRNNGILAQRIDFTGSGAAALRVNESAAFLQDRWVVNRKLTVDAGLRFDRDGIARHANLAPRLSFMFLPLRNSRTVVRGGLGLFYDRMPLSVAYFDDVSRDLEDEEGFSSPLDTSGSFAELPELIVTRFAPDGLTATDGPRRFVNELEGPLRNLRSVRWSLQLDRELTKDLTLRIGYLRRSTTRELLLQPRTISADTDILSLSSTGHSRYTELQILGMYNDPHLGNWN
ncbi:MAG: TonB-dependent receptor, partial [Acidobacteriota bacterium]|nr:TonB-dependent receptor [Acidobacteriota bacterium]